ncbi:probable DNA replication licensing factor MCM4 [Saccharomycodes ludwigii]|uniref:DNA replication licensing factor MCM4 n=1 Tax=Saccharomycodes ludwigii TaxID=36035 RepID=A0A376B927_9ASCO|nr:probable DNA replication licensing factor MCM4 [Saccharomycodes ludwigii]
MSSTDPSSNSNSANDNDVSSPIDASNHQNSFSQNNQPSSPQQQGLFYHSSSSLPETYENNRSSNTRTAHGIYSSSQQPQQRYDTNISSPIGYTDTSSSPYLRRNTSSYQNRRTNDRNEENSTRRNNQSPSSSLHSSRLRRGTANNELDSISSSLGNIGSSNDLRRATSRRNDINSSGMSSPRRIVDISEPHNLLSGSSMLNSSSSLGSSSREGNNDEPLRVIWGTNISIQECSNKFREFLMSFKYKYRKILDGRDEDVNFDTDEELYYVNKMNKMRELGSSNLNLDTRNLLAFKPTEKLYHQLLHYPQELVSIMDQSLKDCMVSLVLDNNVDFNIDEIESKFYKIRPYNVDNRKGVRELNPGDIDKLISIKGLVLRSTPVIPDMKVAFFRCSVCEHTTAVEIDRGLIQEPSRCPRPDCSQANSMVLVHNRCSFSDKQVTKLQETPDLVPDGQTPHSVSLCVYDELVDSCRAGDRVQVTGIFRSIPIRANPRQRVLRSLYKTYVDVVHVKKIDERRLGVDVSTVEQELLQHDMENGDGVDEIRKVTDADITKIREVASRIDVFEILSRSIAPSIYELDDVKKGILLQLFGGTNKVFKKGGKYRGDINILLCGDPSTSKSQLLNYVHKIAPRGVYTSGKGSSAVGLTAYITRDVDTRQLVLESGALVLSDGGVCCIDEFDKMSDSTRSVLHEVMEQQTISIAKAGIITTLNARTSILASANPINSRYNPMLPVTENIDLPPPLLSRFDLVYLILDKVDETSDRELARHLTNLYLEDNPDSGATAGDVLPIEFLTMYISYAKEHFQPVITEIAKDELVKNYVEMRKIGDDSRSDEKRITATTRQLESMIRLSEAHAKMRLSQTVDLEDVREACRLIKAAIKDYATDPKTGKIDMSLVQTGKSAVQLQLQEKLTQEVLNIVANHSSDTISFNELNRILNETSGSGDKVELESVNDALNRLQQEDKIVVLGDGLRRSIRINNSSHL